MLLREWKDCFLSVPWVYDTLRPLVAGGIDHRTLSDFCAVTETDRVFDLGCGTGQMLPFLHFVEYLGVDLDPAALGKAARYSAPHVRFIEGDRWDEPFRQLRPTVALMIGVTHHLADAEFEEIIRRFRAAGASPLRLVTIDVTYFPGQMLNNVLSRMDRGRHVRKAGEYEDLFLRSGLSIRRKGMLTTRLGYVRYLGYHLALCS